MAYRRRWLLLPDSYSTGYLPLEKPGIPLATIEADQIARRLGSTCWPLTRLERILPGVQSNFFAGNTTEAMTETNRTLATTPNVVEIGM